MSDKIRWGVLGVAGINSRVFPSFPRAKHAELAAIASRSSEKAQKAAKADKIPKAYGSYEELLDDPNIDVVYNPLPNTLHAEWTMKAADKGKHILCEKPLAPTAAAAQQMVDYCAAKGIGLMDGFMWPHHPRTVKLRQMLDDGVIGQVQKVIGAFTFPMDPFDGSNIRLRPDLGGGSLLDVGCYPVFGIRWAFGEEPGRAFAAARYEFGVDVDMNGILCFAGGRMAAFDCGFTLPQRQQFEIVGTKGHIYIPKMWLPEPEAKFYLKRKGKAETETISVPGHDQIAHMLDNFSRAVQENKPVQQSPHEGVRTLRAIDALLDSAKTGQTVNL